MATLGKHVLGMPKGPLADSVSFSSWKGKAVIHSLPTSVSNPNTTNQQAIRNKFRLLGQTLVPLADVINIGWKAFEKSGKKAVDAQNMYMKYHLKDVAEADLFNGTSPDFESINADKLLLARGALSGASEAFYASDSLTLTFPDDYEKTNVAYGVLYNPTMQEAVWGSVVTDSASVSILLSPRDDWQGDTVMYYFVTNEQGSKASNSSVVAQ